MSARNQDEEALMFHQMSQHGLAHVNLEVCMEEFMEVVRSDNMFTVDSDGGEHAEMKPAPCKLVCLSWEIRLGLLLVAFLGR